MLDLTVRLRKHVDVLAELIGQQPNVVLMCDLNTPAHGKDLDLLYNRTSLERSPESPATFPSCQHVRARHPTLRPASL